MKSPFIRAWRTHRGLTQVELASEMGMSRPYLSMIERGERRYDQHFLEAAARALDTTPGALISHAPSPRGSIEEMLDALSEQERTRITAIIGELVASQIAARKPSNDQLSV